ncbi:MAG: glycerophosphodiester phosphodiesterase family protein [Acidobacteria bacterium]|nr:glycerophosphodiester phosphodiesterase family protein [Acidobacteriota bacterium]
MAIAISRRSLLALGLAPVALTKRRIAVIAHRGEHLKNPENSLAGIQAAINLGVDYVELDVRTAKSGRLILSHDADFDETKPMVAFDDALKLLRGKCGLYLDWKAASPEALIDALHKHKMIEKTVVYGSFEKLESLAKLDPRLKVMPESVSVPNLSRCLSVLKPKVIAFNHRDFTDEIIAVARQAKVEIYVDRLGPNDNKASWIDAVKRGATGIQTDHPEALITVLSSVHA